MGQDRKRVGELPIVTKGFSLSPESGADVLWESGESGVVLSPSQRTQDPGAPKTAFQATTRSPYAQGFVRAVRACRR
jgi:hypothetical protein